MATDETYKAFLDGSPVIRSHPGAMTGETRYETADGRLWVSRNPCVTTNTDTGVTIARLERRT